MTRTDAALALVLHTSIAAGCAASSPPLDGGGDAATSVAISFGVTINGALERSDHWTSPASGAVEQIGVDAYRATLAAMTEYTVRMCHRSGSTFHTHVQVYDPNGLSNATVNGGGTATASDPSGNLQCVAGLIPTSDGEYTFVARFDDAFVAPAAPGANDYQFRIDVGNMRAVGCPIP